MRELRLGERAALSCSRSQQLFELNTTAAALWRGLARGMSCAEVADGLIEAGARRDEGEAFVLTAVRDWLAHGHVVPEAMAAARLEQTPLEFDIGLGPVAARLRFFGDADFEAALAVFGHLRAGAEARAFQIDIVGEGDEDAVFVDGVLQGMAARIQTAPLLKAVLTDRYCASVREGFLAHGALVSARGRRVFLGGEPGAGKTTLTLALCGSGFLYGGDDTVEIDARGAAVGAPFAACVKSGAWGLLAGYAPAVAALTTHIRPDGQLVRYYLPEQRDLAGPRPIDVVLKLERRKNVRAELAPLDPLDALCMLIESGYAERGGVEGDTLEALAHDLSRAVCRRLIYGDLASAVALVQHLTDE